MKQDDFISFFVVCHYGGYSEGVVKNKAAKLDSQSTFGSFYQQKWR